MNCTITHKSKLMSIMSQSRGGCYSIWGVDIQRSLIRNELVIPADTQTSENRSSYLISVKCQTELEETALAHCLHTWKTVYLS